MKNKGKGILLELTATILWASSFVVTKGTTDDFPPMLLVGIRFLLGALVVAILYRKKFKKTSIEMIITMAVVGFFYSIGMILQTYGIKYTSAGRSAFITAAYCIWVPILELIIFKKKPTLKYFFSALICMAGVGLIVLENGLEVDAGDLYTLFGSMCLAVEIAVFGNVVNKFDSDLASFYLLLFSGVTAMIPSIVTETYPASLSTPTIMAILYLAFACTGIAMLCQGAAQNHISPGVVTIILGFEAVFAAIISTIVYAESFTSKCLIGCLLVFISTFIVLIEKKK